jgi:hypothetical protein
VSAETPYERGERRAVEDRAKTPPPDPHTVTVSTYVDGFDRHHFKLCRHCHWGLDHCTCQETTP